MLGECVGHSGYHQRFSPTGAVLDAGLEGDALIWDMLFQASRKTHLLFEDLAERSPRGAGFILLCMFALCEVYF